MCGIWVETLVTTPVDQLHGVENPPIVSMIFPAQWTTFQHAEGLHKLLQGFFLAVQCAPRAQISASLPIVWLGQSAGVCL